MSEKRREYFLVKNKFWGGFTKIPRLFQVFQVFQTKKKSMTFPGFPESWPPGQVIYNLQGFSLSRYTYDHRVIFLLENQHLTSRFLPFRSRINNQEAAAGKWVANTTIGRTASCTGSFAGGKYRKVKSYHSAFKCWDRWASVHMVKSHGGLNCFLASQCDVINLFTQEICVWCCQNAAFIFWRGK